MMWSSLTNSLLTIWMIVSVQLLRYSNRAAEMDNEFAEFEDMEMEYMSEQEVTLKPHGEANKGPRDKSATVDDNDEDEFTDEDEFSRPIKKAHRQKTESEILPQLRFADVPAHFRSNWASYQVEALVLSVLVLYMLNYIFGRARNRNIANKWFMDATSLLEEQFTLVGDDGTSENLREGHMHKETDSIYTIWCSGRVGCQGMLITLKLVKRQDLIHVVMNLIRPKEDKVIIRIDVDNNEMDSFVFAIGQRKLVTKASKEKMDLSLFTIERKGVDRLGLPSSIVVYAEMFEAVNAIIDPAVLSMFRKYENAIDYFHFSDQYSGYKPSDGESFTRLPETSRVLFFAFKMSSDIVEIDALLRMVFHCFEKIRRYRLSREGKLKADKKRQSVQEAFLKTTHQARQEAAQARREEKTRERKQRLLEEEDPEKQRRLEKLEQKRDMKMRQPKMKQLKVK
ncbi:CG17593-PA, putative [Brugia malayi]|nr:CG17593-PA, putative [Brugia malayi]VIO91326.1 CG17593-PA, putative [Brugia malayi]